MGGEELAGLAPRPFLAAEAGDQLALVRDDREPRASRFGALRLTGMLGPSSPMKQCGHEPLGVKGRRVQVCGQPDKVGE